MKQIILSSAISLLTMTGFAQGTYSEFRITSADGISGTTHSYSQDGNTRTETHMSMPKSSVKEMDQVTLTLRAHPDVLYHLHDKDKSYTESPIRIHPNHPDAPSHYEVTEVGKEKADGFNATHVIIKASDQSKGIELWLSTDIQGYAAYKSGYNQYINDDIYKALAAKGLEGLPVKVKAGEHGMDIQMDLVKTEIRSNPLSLFSLDGYAKSAVHAGNNRQDGGFAKKMQDMTPQERQMMIDSLRRLYGK